MLMPANTMAASKNFSEFSGLWFAIRPANRNWYFSQQALKMGVKVPGTKYSFWCERDIRGTNGTKWEKYGVKVLRCERAYCILTGSLRRLMFFKIKAPYSCFWPRLYTNCIVTVYSGTVTWSNCKLTASSGSKYINKSPGKKLFLQGLKLWLLFQNKSPTE